MLFLKKKKNHSFPRGRSCNFVPCPSGRGTGVQCIYHSDRKCRRIYDAASGAGRNVQYKRQDAAGYHSALGGRVAEEIIFDDITTGASQDIKQATGIAKSMVTKFGMSEKVGLINYDDDSDEVSSEEILPMLPGVTVRMLPV